MRKQNLTPRRRPAKECGTAEQQEPERAADPRAGGKPSGAMRMWHNPYVEDDCGEDRSATRTSARMSKSKPAHEFASANGKT